MTYRLHKQTSGRLARLEAAVTAGGTVDALTDEEVTAGISSELWLLLASGIIVPNTAGQWCVPQDKGIPRYDVPQPLVDILNQPGPFRDMAEAIGRSGEAAYTLTDDGGRVFTVEVWPA